MRAAVVVQARAGSSRLPGKIFKRVGGRTVLAHVIARAREIPGASVVHVTTTRRCEDDAVVHVSRGGGARLSRGQVPLAGRPGRNDVLAGYVLAAERERADVVVRVTSDCPLLDPAVAGDVLGALVHRGADYASNVCPPSLYDGCDVEAFTAGALARAYREAGPDEREHVTTWLRRAPGVRRVNVRYGVDAAWVKLSVDDADDLRRVRRTWLALRNKVGFGWRDVLSAYFRSHPCPVMVRAASMYPRGIGAERSDRLSLAYLRGAAGLACADDDTFYAWKLGREDAVAPEELQRVAAYLASRRAD